MQRLPEQRSGGERRGGAEQLDIALPAAVDLEEQSVAVLRPADGDDVPLAEGEQHRPLGRVGEIVLAVDGEPPAAEDGPFTKLATRSEAGQDVVISANETHGRNFELQLVLATGTDPTASPEIRGYTLICLPASQSGETYTVGLKLYPEQQVNGYDVYMDVAAELAFLKALRANKTVFKYQEGATSYTATLEDYSWRPEFTEDGDAYCGVFWAVMKSLTPPSAS